jgi:hypothetical protein
MLQIRVPSKMKRKERDQNQGGEGSKGERKGIEMLS